MQFNEMERGRLSRTAIIAKTTNARSWGKAPLPTGSIVPNIISKVEFNCEMNIDIKMNSLLEFVTNLLFEQRRDTIMLSLVVLILPTNFLT